jgi:sec-independent protein translocase protein TatC
MAATDPRPEGNGGADLEQPFLTHLIELRDRLLRMVIAVLVVFLGLAPFANTLYSLLADPLLRHMPEGSSMIAIEVASPFLIPFKLALVLAIFICVPFLLYQLWAFIAPGLYRHERRLALPVLVSSTLLFYLGGLFAYFVVFPLVFAFLTASAPEGVSVMTDIGKYLDFVLTLFFAFGAAFEVPVVTFVLVWMGLTTPAALAEKRPYVIVGAFVIGMLLTPPDVISQTLLAVPMWLLFELGVFMARTFVPKKSEADAETGQSDYQPPSEAEMDAELDRIEADERKEASKPDPNP